MIVIGSLSPVHQGLEISTGKNAQWKSQEKHGPSVLGQ